jgi:hypothetical protein
METKIGLADCCFTCVNGKIECNWHGPYKNYRLLWCDFNKLKARETNLCDHFEKERYEQETQEEE